MYNETNKGQQIHYICIATQQNSINILPLFTDTKYKISEVKKITILSSGSPKVMNWTKQLNAFMEEEHLLQSKLQIETLMMEDFNKAGKLLDVYLNNEKHVVINIGGGVKSIALSIWTYAIADDWKRNWEIIYPSIEDRCLDVYSRNDHSTYDLHSKVMVDHLLKLYAFKISEDKGMAPYLENYFTNPAFRIDFYNKLNITRSINEADANLEVVENFEQLKLVNEKTKNNLLNLLLKYTIEYTDNLKSNFNTYKNDMLEILKLNQISNIKFPADLPIPTINIDPLVKTAFSIKNLQLALNEPIEKSQSITEAYNKYGTGCSPGTYFERTIQWDINQYITSKYPDKVLEMKFNLKVSREHLIERDAEHDILLNIYNGQLISIDAKTFKSDPKDLLSRIKRLENLAGIYTRFVVVIPYFWEDFTPDNLEAIPYLKTLRSLPFFFNDHRIPFCVYAGNEEDFTVTASNGNIQKVDTSSVQVPGKSVRITHYKKYLDDLFAPKNK